MDHKSSLDHEKTVGFAYFARRDPAIHRLSVTPNHLRKFGYREVLTRCGSGLDISPPHDRLSSRYSDALLSMSFCYRRALPQFGCQRQNPPNCRVLVMSHSWKS